MQNPLPTTNQPLQFTPSPQKYLSKLLHLNHTNLFNFQTSHIMILYFTIQGMTVCGTKIDDKIKKNIIKYIKSLQLPTGGYSPSSLYTTYSEMATKTNNNNNEQNSKISHVNNNNINNNNKYILPHIVFTYSAVNILKIFDCLQQINKQKCLESVFKCQQQNGSFSNFQNSNQADLRFVYAAVVIWNILMEKEGKQSKQSKQSKLFNQSTQSKQTNKNKINKDKIIEYIKKCRNYDGGYGLRPYCQSHCGAVYCAVASMKILGVKLNKKKQQQTLQFLVNRQTVNDQNIHNKNTKQNNQNNPTALPYPYLTGIQGRVGKLPDSCYTFWVGASIKILTSSNLLHQSIQNFLQLCYNIQTYSFSKYPNMKGDPLHTLHSMVGLMVLRGKDERVNLVEGNCMVREE